MAIAQLTSRTVVTKIVAQGQVINTTVTPVTVHTVPAGKRTRITGVIWCVDFGAASEGRVVADGIIIARWTSTGTFDTDSKPDSVGGSGMRINVYYHIDIILEAGEVLELLQNSGTNTQFKRALKIEELPA